ncbi:MAG: cytochrome c-type biogenesis protein CcmH [Thermoleophilia bacterium]|nr:cytochrome c-type biogenesis protein CcmH [Thermoleophilia bacterium]
MRSRVAFGRGGRLVAACVLVTALFMAIATAAAMAAPPVSSVADKITCLCGCNSVLSQCPHEECGWGVPAKQFIGEQLDKGKTPEELIQYYVTQYGEQVLAAPTKTGFNLAAWVTPFVALIVGAVAIYYLARVWVVRQKDGADHDIAPAPVRTEAPEEYARRLDDELKDFD